MGKYQRIELKGSFGQWIAHVLECGYVSGSTETPAAEFSHDGNRFYAALDECEGHIEVALVDGPLHNYSSKSAKKVAEKLNNLWLHTFYRAEKPEKEEEIDTALEWRERYRLLKKAYDRLREENIHLKYKKQKGACHSHSEAKSTSFTP